MAKSVVVEQSRAIPVQSEDAFGGTLAAALPVICSHWYGLIPPIKEVRIKRVLGILSDRPVSSRWSAAGACARS